VATSETSARVGTGLWIIDSSICVATTTGLPARRASRVICFCRLGTRSSGSSTPRVAARHHQCVGGFENFGKRSIACGFSIFAITAARPRISFFASLTSSARCTNDSATQSIPGHQCRLEVGAVLRRHRGHRQVGVGQADALAVRHFSADHDAGDSAIRRSFLGDQANLAVIQQAAAWPGFSAARISGCGSWTRVASPGALSESSTKLAPFLSWTEPSAKEPTRSLGP